MATCTITGNIRNINRLAEWGTVRITSTDAAKAEGSDLVIPGTGVVVLDASGNFSLALGTGTYALTLNDQSQVTLTIPVDPPPTANLVDVMD